MTDRPHVEGYTNDPTVTRALLHPLTIQVFCAWPWLRKRLECPRCEAIGTWKPHGSRRAQREGDRPARRWLCKWCGLYLGPEGWLTCVVNNEAGYWDLPWNVPHGTTPREVVAASVIPKTNPWRG